MMRFLGFIGIASWGALALSGCGDASLAGRPNSSETENAVAARILDSRGKPVAGVRVGISDSSSWEHGFLDRAGVFPYQDVSDDSGRVRFLLPDGPKWVAFAASASEGFFLPIDSSAATVTWRTAPLCSLSGRLVGLPSASSQICLQGTDRCANLSSDGGYSFGDLPSGVYTPVLAPFTSTSLRRLGSYSLAANSAGVRDTVILPADTTLLDDFEDGDAYGSLRSWSGTSKWWVYSVFATSTPTGAVDFSSRLVADSSRPGKVLNLTTSGMDSANGSLVLLGLDIGAGTQASDSSKVFADLSRLRMLRFRIKGTGTLSILLQTRKILQLGDDRQLHATLALTGQWQDVVLAPSDFVTYPGSLAAKAGLGFANLADRTSAIVFQFRENGDYRLDDIRMEGPTILFLKDWKN